MKENLQLQSSAEVISNMEGMMFEGGSFVEHAGIKVLNLRGSWKAMGRQYGYFAANYIRDVYQNFMQPKFKEKPGSETRVAEIAEKLYKTCPYRFKQLFAGAAETSGLTLEELKMANVVEYAAEEYNCSAMAVWHDYAAGELIYGRNYDGPFQSLCHDLLITVYHPEDGALAVATIGYAGEIYVVNGINEKGFFVELNNGMPSAGTEILYERLSGTTELMSMLFDADSMDYVDAFFQTMKGFASFIIGVSDGQEARSYEWCAQGMQRGDVSTPDGLMVMTNHYVSENWPFTQPDDGASWISQTRRKNLLARAEQHKGTIDVKTMQQIMGTSIEEGGPKHELTVYQLVFAPQRMTLWMKISHLTDWQCVDLKTFFFR